MAHDTTRSLMALAACFPDARLHMYSEVTSSSSGMFPGDVRHLVTRHDFSTFLSAALPSPAIAYWRTGTVWQ